MQEESLGDKKGEEQIRGEEVEREETEAQEIRSQENVVSLLIDPIELEFPYGIIIPLADVNRGRPS